MVKLYKIKITSVIIPLIILILVFFIAKDPDTYTTTRFIQITGGAIVLTVTFLNPSMALYILIFAMLFSPEFRVAGLSQRRDVSIRTEDIIILFMTLGWLAHFLVRKGFGYFIRTPLNKPIFLFLLSAFVSTLIGITFYKTNLSSGMLYFIKYVEYFLVFFLVIHNTKNANHARSLILALIITGLLTGIYSLYAIQTLKVGRVAAPFDEGEANTYGGYLALIISLLLGFILNFGSNRIRIGLAAVIMLLIPPFIFTLSRSSYIAIIISYITLIIYAAKKKMLIGILLLAIFGFFIYTPEVVQTRISKTYQQTQSVTRVTFMGYTFDDSFSQRITSWDNVLSNLIYYPLFGKGLTGMGFIDGQYFRNLIEFGIIGFILFISLLYNIFSFIKKRMYQKSDRFYKALCMGTLAGYCGLLFHAISSNTFMIIRIMEPFCFILGLIFIYPLLLDKEIEEKSHLRKLPIIPNLPINIKLRG